MWMEKELNWFQKTLDLLNKHAENGVTVEELLNYSVEDLDDFLYEAVSYNVMEKEEYKNEQLKTTYSCHIRYNPQEIDKNEEN
jgi:hypothetical protein